MWYISFHGGDSGVNNIQVYHNSWKPHSNPNLLTIDNQNPLKELRSFKIVDNLLYVVNGYHKYSQLLNYKINSHGTYDLNAVVADKNPIEGIFHPYDFTFDQAGNIYISSQDSNVVTGIKGINAPMDTAPYLINHYGPSANFLSGTRVASSIGDLPGVPANSPPDVATPQGLDVNFKDDKKTKVAHSVRGVLYYNNYLFVSDEPANSVKIYALESGEYHGQIIGENLSAPVQLLEKEGTIYIGSSKNKSVVTCNVSKGVPSGDYAPKTFIDGHVKHISGMAFDADGNFYAAERKARKIKMFPPDGSGSGKTVIKDLPDNPEFILYVPKTQ